MGLILKKSLIIILIIFSILILSNSSFAETPTPTPIPTIAPTSGPTPTPDPSTKSSDIKDCADNHISVADCPQYIQSKLNDLQGQDKSLSNQISVMNSQMYLTQARIDATKGEITSLTLDIEAATKKISNLEQSLNDFTKVLLKRIVATYEVGSTPSLQVLLTSNNMSNFLTRANYLKLVQAHDKELIYDTQQAKIDYANQKEISEVEKAKIESLKKQLEAYTVQLAGEKKDKQRLLSETQGSEANYQRLLAEAKAQLAGFSKFVESRGGASLLSNQTVCDDWGCYYNQRDSSWGSLSLNGTQYTLASDGCLVTSMAMVYTHFGHKNVTPITINSNSSNFASYYPAYLSKTIVADSATSTRVGASIDGELSSGRPVVVGISYNGGPLPDHFVVLISGSSGNYIMNDPFTPNGHKIPFTDHYSVGSIVEVDKIVGL